jgi:exodeoxyribonuclease V alpha subunit
MDLIDSEMVPVITFDKIHRQGAKSGIIPFSIQIAQGKTKYKDGWVGEETLGELQDLTVVGYKHDKTSQEERASTQLIIQHFKKMYRRCKDISQIAVVVPTRANGTGCYKLNQLIQDIVLPTRRGPGIQLGTKNQPFTVYKGDKVINLVNNYEVKPNIFNGNMGEIVEIDIENKKVVVDFYNIGLVEMKGKNLDNLDLGYAITCHKAQGSTIPYLIYCLDYSHFVMLNRQQAYTGITRAKKQAVLIIETKAFNRAVRTNHVVHKRTFLYHFLVGELEING